MTEIQERLEQIIVETALAGTTRIDSVVIIAKMRALGHDVTADDVADAYDNLEKRILDDISKTPTATPGIVRDPANCLNCRVIFPIYVYTVPPGTSMSGKHTYNVTKAINFVKSRPRERLLVPRLTVKDIVRVNGVEERHLDHVDPAFPGIAVPFLDADDNPIMILIDGNHRAGRCIRDNLDFYVYPLTSQEAEDCLISSPTKPPLQGGILIL